MVTNSTLSIPIPDGIYIGSWHKHYVQIVLAGETITFKVDKKLGRQYACVVKVSDKKATVDSGNPITIAQ